MAITEPKQTKGGCRRNSTLTKQTRRGHTFLQLREKRVEVSSCIKTPYFPLLKTLNNPMVVFGTYQGAPYMGLHGRAAFLSGQGLDLDTT